MAPIAEKAQHEPHCPWFFTEVTPVALQSTAGLLPTWRSLFPPLLLADGWFEVWVRGIEVVSSSSSVDVSYDSSCSVGDEGLSSSWTFFGTTLFFLDTLTGLDFLTVFWTIGSFESS